MEDMKRSALLFEVPIVGPLDSFLTKAYNTVPMMRLLTAVLQRPVRHKYGDDLFTKYIIFIILLYPFDTLCHNEGQIHESKLYAVPILDG